MTKKDVDIVIGQIMSGDTDVYRPFPDDALDAIDELKADPTPENAERVRKLCYESLDERDRIRATPQLVLENN
jgi:hypothetical protein